MKYCKTCNVHYDTTLENCLFCNAELNETGTKESSYKFATHKKRKSTSFIFRLFLLTNIISAGLSVFLDLQSGWHLDWSLIVLIANIYAIILYTIWFVSSAWTSKLTKSLVLTITSLIFLGLSTGDHHWAVDYVFPLGLAANIILLSVLLLSNRRKWFDYAVNLFIISLVGLVPGILSFTPVTIDKWPSLVSFWVSISALLGMFLFSSKASKEEFRRRFHV